MAARTADFLATVDRVIASALAREDLRTVHQAGDQVLAAGKTGPGIGFPTPQNAEPVPGRLSIVSPDRAVIIDLIARDRGTLVRVTSAGSARAIWAGRSATLLFRAADLSVAIRFSEAGVAQVELTLPLAALVAGPIELGTS